MAKKNGELTPMMKQFFDLKEKHPNALLLFRCGDFYETYCDDAETAAKVLGITLTRRNNGASKGDAMAGFPYHALDIYLPRLIRAGHRVAICDQLEDPKKTKTLVKRGVTELVTPGVVQQDNVLQNKENNFLCAVQIGKGSIGVSFLDISTGEFMCGEGNYDYAVKLIESFQPKEVLYDRTKRNDFFQHFPAKLCVYEMDDWVFSLDTGYQKLCKHFKVRNLKGFGIDHLKNGVIAAGAIMHYLDITQHTRISHITAITRLETDKYVRLDNFTLRSLELLSPMSPDGMSLLNVIDRTATAMGGRMLRRWLTFPLTNAQQITDRLNIVEYYFRNPEFRDIVDEQFHRIADLERIISKVSTRRVSPREMRALAQALEAVAIVKYACSHTDNESLRQTSALLEPCTDMCERIKREIVPEPPQLIVKGGVIRSGVNAQLDELREIHTNGKNYLLKLQQKEAERTGIASLKIGYNNVFGYYLEVRNTYKDCVPSEWIRKQTLAQAERYITQELKEYEDKILGAEERILEIEQQVYNTLVDDCQHIIHDIQQDAMIIAQLDCLLSFAIISREHRYVRPVIASDSILDIRAGRHPVIECNMPVGEEYVPNDISIGTPTSIMIITGPNMAGKSALLRQTALIVVMAQIGCFVPADAAHVGIVDRIFTRVGASDNLSQGESTFMVEMTEASNILNNVTDRSLVLFDELGRGTSTYDGISIAWSIVEYLAQQGGPNPRTLFATHYHELNEMAQHFPCIRNYNVSVMETDQKVIFLRKLVEGGSEHSFGIHVAEIAGMPKQIIKRANVILRQLEKDNSGVGREAAKEGSADPKVQGINTPAPAAGGTEMSFYQLDDPILAQIRDELLDLDVDNLTPLQALNKLNDIKKILKG